MRIIKGNQKIEINKQQLVKMLNPFKKVVLDLGTGDGRYVYKNALINLDTFYIGVDPSASSLEEFSKKAVKQKLNNTLFVVGSLEVFPNELEGIADELVINLPWGTLLLAIVKPTPQTLVKLASILKKPGMLTVIFGYDSNLEPSETKRLNLATITEKQITEEIIPSFEEKGFVLQKCATLSPPDLKMLESTWGKKIALRQERPVFMLAFKYD